MMPKLCRFYGIVVRMYFNDHALLTSTPAMESTKLPSSLKVSKCYPVDCRLGRGAS